MELDQQNLNGNPPVAAPPAVAQTVVTPQGQVDPSIQPFLADQQQPPAQQGSIVPPATPQPPAQTPEQIEAYRRIQSDLDRERAARMALEQALQQLNPQQAPQAPQTNPFNPQTESAMWVQWEVKNGVREALTEQQKIIDQRFQQAQMQTQEIAWQNAHPGVDVRMIKQFNQANGIADWNLEAGFRLMYNQQPYPGMAQNPMQQPIQQFRQGQNTPAPIRNAQSGNGIGQTALVFEPMLKAYVANPAIREQWSPELKNAFDQELSFRQSQQIHG